MRNEMKLHEQKPFERWCREQLLLRHNLQVTFLKVVKKLCIIMTIAAQKNNKKTSRSLLQGLSEWVGSSAVYGWLSAGRGRRWHIQGRRWKTQWWHSVSPMWPSPLDGYSPSRKRRMKLVLCEEMTEDTNTVQNNTNELNTKENTHIDIVRA